MFHAVPSTNFTKFGPFPKSYCDQIRRGAAPGRDNIVGQSGFVNLPRSADAKNFPTSGISDLNATGAPMDLERIDKKKTDGKRQSRHSRPKHMKKSAPRDPGMPPGSTVRMHAALRRGRRLYLLRY